MSKPQISLQSTNNVGTIVNSGIINLSGNLAIGHSNWYKFAQNFTTTAYITYNNFMFLESKGRTHSSV